MTVEKVPAKKKKWAKKEMAMDKSAHEKPMAKVKGRAQMMKSMYGKKA